MESTKDEEQPSPDPAVVARWKPTWTAAWYGALAGAVSAVALVLMNTVQAIVWSVSDARWYIVVVIMTGGALLALLRSRAGRDSLDEQIAEASEPTSLRRRKTALLALSAIIAVGFGGAIGPEAGLIAIVGELSALVSLRIAHTRAEAQLLGRAGTAAALAGLYGSPPGGAAYDDDSLSPPKALYFLAGTTGFLSFLVVYGQLSQGHHGLGLDPYPAADVTALLLSVVPALGAALLAAGYVTVRPLIATAVGRPRNIAVQTLLGSAVFAAIATAVPLVRFSGHAEFPELLHLAHEESWLALAGLAALKLVCTGLNVASGWLGGEIFPLMFAGSAVGAATLLLVPGLPLTAAIVAGMGAAATIGLRKPLAVALICMFYIDGAALGPLIIGVAVGMVGTRLLPAPPPSAH